MAVAGNIFHDGTAEQVQVCATSERDGGFPLGGLGLSSQANHGTNHQRNRDYSSDCHVAPLGLAQPPGVLTSKTGGIG